jgi:tRNA(adenine34) deaminase
VGISGWSESDLDFMREALAEARLAVGAGEVPVGAVITMSGRIVGRAHNRTIGDCDPSGHAEIVALRQAAEALGNHRLSGATVYVTLEPCAMCVGAMIQARVARVVFAAYDERAGALGSVLDLSAVPEFNHRIEVNGSLLAEEAAALLQTFFEERRAPSGR